MSDDAQILSRIESGDRSRSEERFRGLLESSPDALIIVDQHGAIVMINAQTERLFGYRREDLIGQVVEMLVPERHRLDHISHRVAFSRGPGLGPINQGLAVPGRHRDGHEFPVEISLSSLEAEEGLLIVAAVREVSERERLIGALRDSESTYRLLAENSTDMISRHDPEGIYVYASPACRRLLGFDSDELIGHSACEFIYSDDRDEVARVHAALRAHPEPSTVSFRILHKDGSCSWCESSVHAVRDSGTGDIHEIQCVTRDISARKQVEEALRESEENYRTVADFAYDWEYWLAPDGGLPYVSPSCERITGYRAEQFQQDPGLLLRIAHPDDRDRLTWHFREENVAANAEECEMDFRILTRSGEERWIAHACQGVRGRDGQYLGRRASNRDISERKQLEDALRESDERTQSIVKHVVDGIITIDATGIIRSVNPAVERIFRYGGGELLGRNVNILMPEPYHSEHDAYLANYLRTGVTKVIGVGREVEGRRKDGTTFPLELSISEFFLAGTRMFTGVVRDITDRKRISQRLAAEHGVARILAESRSITEAAPQLIEAIAGNLGWEVGGVWNLDRQTNILRCLEFWHAPSFTSPEFEAVSRRVTFASGVGLPGRVWASGKVGWIPDVTADANFPRASAAAHDGLRWGIAFPIRSSDGTLGVIDFYRREGEEPDRPLLEMFESITSQVARFIEHRNAEQRIVERQTEVDIAKTIQLGFLPKAPPILEGMSVGGVSRPAQETGGDYFDFINLPTGHLMIPLGDVSGHGLGAALIMAKIQAYLRAFAMTGMHIGPILNFANSLLAEDAKGEKFMTLFLTLLNPFSRSLIYSNAGQGPAYVFNDRGELKATLDSTDIPLGVDLNHVFRNDRVLILDSGDLVLLMTDGILEACSAEGTSFGSERALAVVRRHRREEPSLIAEHLIREACLFCGNLQVDDMTVVVIKVE